MFRYKSWQIILCILTNCSYLLCREAKDIQSPSQCWKRNEKNEDWGLKPTGFKIYYKTMTTYRGCYFKNNILGGQLNRIMIIEIASLTHIFDK